MRICKLFILLLVFAPLGLNAQIQVRLHQPPPNQLLIEHLWWVDLNNTAIETYTVYLHAEVTEAQKGLIFRTNTNNFSLPPGNKRIRPRDITNIKDTWYFPKYKEFIIRTGKLPEGNYTVCIYVKQARTGQPMGEDCIHQVVYLPGAPRLISPVDDAMVKEKHPLFTWTRPAPVPQGEHVTYTLRIVEVLKGQTKEEAIRSNIPWFERSGITATRFRYPVQARRLERGKKYTWQVKAFFEEGFQPLSSEGWCFSRAKLKFKPVFKELFPLKVTREVVRHGNWYEVILNLTNIGSKDISNIVVTDSNLGFQCIDTAKAYFKTETTGTIGQYMALPSWVPCRVENDIFSRSSLIVIDLTSPEWALAPGKTIVLRYYIVPVIYLSIRYEPYHVVGKELRVSYRVGGEQCSAKSPGLAEDLEPDVGNAFRNANYLIVTNPDRVCLFNPVNPGEVWKLFATMARLAKEKRGVLGYFNNHFTGAGTYAENYRNRIVNEMGSKLKPDWTQFGYLLLVGEGEIIPHRSPFSITINEQGDKRTIILSDFIYANISGDLRPELKVGRIIGNTASNLIIPIEQSLAVLQHQGAENDGSQALFISGVPKPNDGDRFRLDVNSGAQYLDQYKKVLSAKLHMEDWGSEVVVQALLKHVLPGKDYVFYCGHGGSNGWAYFGTGDVSSANITSKDTRPIVVTVACHTGNYTGGFAREFLRYGAGAYVGGTVMLNVGDNKRHIRNYGLLKHYNKGRRIGNILKAWKTYLTSTASLLDRRLLYAMNLYGDPKFGGD